VNTDLIIAGGGLAGSLAAWRLASVRPGWRVRLLESAARLGGSHTWSFHDTDLSAGARRWIDPLVVAQWPCHEVRFPGRTRPLVGGYASITADRLHDVIAASLGDRLRLHAPVAHLTPTTVTLSSGEVLAARVVVDARGASPASGPAGWQTFLGQDVEIDVDHGLRWPVLMDATVPQEGGFRFTYLLPWSSTRLLIEDTVYADTPDIDEPASRERIAAYAAARGWTVRTVLREERGALPIPLGGAGEAFWPDRVTRIGVRAGLFHPTTGYSLPDAVATADLLAALNPHDPGAFFTAMRQAAVRSWRARAFFRLLNRLMFRAAAPSERMGILEQFYARPEPLIARFYAGRLSWFDRCRLLSGRPPVPLSKALPQLVGGVW
jgi:lycopene beta-cyclase